MEANSLWASPMNTTEQTYFWTSSADHRAYYLPVTSARFGNLTHCSGAWSFDF